MNLFYQVPQRVIYTIVFIFLIISCTQNKKNTNVSFNQKSNELINETSPYLLQHAYNPVNWKAWNDKTLSSAKEQNKLIVISIGYSACHWCHVMEKESFENDSVAKLMNERFINIKVDREERPDIDQVYINAVTLMTGSAGWPLNVIALPDGRPVFGGTYFTKQQWLKVLEQASNLYQTDPVKVLAYAEKLTEGIKKTDLIEVNTDDVSFNMDDLKRLVESYKNKLDFELGGQKQAPKFPLPNHLEMMLRYAYHFEDSEALNYVTNTLDKMAYGGLYDYVAGGFARYSVDDKWQVPHFEKMLYDNAQMVSIYAHAYKLTKKETFRTIIEETIGFVNSQMTSEEGAFYSSIDADSKNVKGDLEEGIYYTWTIEELKQLLKDDYELFKDFFNINVNGFWKNKRYVLFRSNSDIEFANKQNIDIDNLQQKLKGWKTILNEERRKRFPPGKDDKSLTSWNALMLIAYLDAYQALGENIYLERALKNANFIKEKLLLDNGVLLHSYKNGKSSIIGFAEDYAHVINAYIKLYQTTLNKSWLNLAKSLMDYTIENFQNSENSMFYFTSDNNSSLIARTTEVYDNVIPASNSVLAINAFKLGHYYCDKTYLNLAKQMLSNISNEINESPDAFTNWLQLYINYASPFYEVAISGPRAEERLININSTYIPNIIVAGGTKEDNLPLLINKFTEGNTAIYVCINGTCKLPVEEVEDALSQIKK